jgi:transcription initiation factor TFIIB
MEVKTEMNVILADSKCEKCPECGSPNLIHDYDNGETVCGECGLVLHQEMDNTKRRAYNPEQRAARSQTGPPQLLTVHDKGLTTKVGYSGEKTDAYKKRISSGTLNQMHRLNKWQIRSRVHSSRDRNLIHAMQEISRICDKIMIPSKSSIREQSSVIYRKALKENIVRGRSIDAITAASIYYACRICKIPKDLKEVADASLVDKKDLSRCYRHLYKILNIKPPISDPMIFISKIAEIAGVSEKTKGLAIKLLNQDKRFKAGNSPEGSAAAALYIACLLSIEKITQKDIADAAGVTEVTVRNRYKILKKKLNIKIPDKNKKSTKRSLFLNHYFC